MADPVAGVGSGAMAMVKATVSLAEGTVAEGTAVATAAATALVDSEVAEKEDLEVVAEEEAWAVKTEGEGTDPEMGAGAMAREMAVTTAEGMGAVAMAGAKAEEAAREETGEECKGSVSCLGEATARETVAAALARQTVDMVEATVVCKSIETQIESCRFSLRLATAGMAGRTAIRIETEPDNPENQCQRCIRL